MSGEQNIAELWHDHFESLLNSVRNSKDKEEVEGRMASCDSSPVVVVKISDVRLIIDEPCNVASQLILTCLYILFNVQLVFACMYIFFNVQLLLVRHSVLSCI